MPAFHVSLAISEGKPALSQCSAEPMIFDAPFILGLLYFSNGSNTNFATGVALSIGVQVLLEQSQESLNLFATIPIVIINTPNVTDPRDAADWVAILGNVNDEPRVHHDALFAYEGFRKGVVLEGRIRAIIGPASLPEGAALLASSEFAIESQEYVLEVLGFVPSDDETFA